MCSWHHWFLTQGSSGSTSSQYGQTSFLVEAHDFHSTTLVVLLLIALAGNGQNQKRNNWPVVQPPCQHTHSLHSINQMASYCYVHTSIVYQLPKTTYVFPIKIDRDLGSRRGGSIMAKDVAPLLTLVFVMGACYNKPLPTSICHGLSVLTDSLVLYFLLWVSISTSNQPYSIINTVNQITSMSKTIFDHDSHQRNISQNEIH